MKTMIFERSFEMTLKRSVLCSMDLAYVSEHVRAMTLNKSDEARMLRVHKNCEKHVQVVRTFLATRPEGLQSKKIPYGWMIQIIEFERHRDHLLKILRFAHFRAITNAYRYW